MNSLMIPGGILQDYMFHPGVPKYLNYGAIGSIIGHEMSHGFDSSGHKYDEAGDERNWWKNETLKKYWERATCVRKQYDDFHIKRINVTINLIRC